MRRQWTVRRTRQPEPDGQRRWDRAYQELLAGTRAGSGDEGRADVGPEPSDLEVKNESSSLGPRLDTAPSASPDGRAAIGSTEEVRRRARLARPDRERFPRGWLSRRFPETSRPGSSAGSSGGSYPRSRVAHGTRSS